MVIYVSKKFLYVSDLLTDLIIICQLMLAANSKSVVLDPEGLRSQAEEGARFGYTGIVTSNKQYY